MRFALRYVLHYGRFGAAALAVTTLFGGGVGAQAPVRPERPTATLVSAPELEFVNETDSNSPALWQLVNGRPLLHVLNSIDGRPALSVGRNLQRLKSLEEVEYAVAPPGGSWMEAVVDDEAGTFYGYYHNEIVGAACPGTNKALPRIGAARSSDRGRTWEDLGPILEAPAATVRCSTPNHYFVGGVGDFSVMLDPDREYLYFFYSQYVESEGREGVSVARMVWAGRDEPQGRLAVWSDGAWLPAELVEILDEESGEIDARWVYPVATPVHLARQPWGDRRREVDVWWGPAVHWNTFLSSYVMLLNRAVSNEFAQGSIDISYAPTLDDPGAWSSPVTLMKGGSWYPQVMGLEPGLGTDKVAGEEARFYINGKSDFLIRFARP